MPRNRTGYLVGEEAARRIANTVRTVERLPGPASPGDGPSVASRPAYYAIVSTAIAPISGSSLAAGKAILQDIIPDKSGSVVKYNLKPVPMIGPVVVLSGASATIATGRTIVVELISGSYSVVVDFC